jgi:hypothetical protein
MGVGWQEGQIEKYDYYGACVHCLARKHDT